MISSDTGEVKHQLLVDRAVVRDRKTKEEQSVHRLARLQAQNHLNNEVIDHLLYNG